MLSCQKILSPYYFLHLFPKIKKSINMFYAPILPILLTVVYFYKPSSKLKTKANCLIENMISDDRHEI